MHTVGILWGWISVREQVPNQSLLLIAAGLGALLAIAPATWRPMRLFATYVHEAGHALMAMASGRFVSGIRIHGDSSGVTRYVGRVGGIGSILTPFAGYPAPALAGWGLLAAVDHAHVRWAIAGFTAVAALLLLFQHSLRGLAISLGIGAACWGLTQMQGVVAGTLAAGVAGFLLVASPRTIVELRVTRARALEGDSSMLPHSDADILGQSTLLPAWVWEVLFLLVSGVCVWQAIHGLWQ